MTDSPFGSIEAFRSAFQAGLQRLLQAPSPGGYILVHANAGFDPALMRQLQGQLQRCYRLLAREQEERVSAGRDSGDAPDDLAVFRSLMALGFEGVQASGFRTVGEWELQFNHLRSLRPARLSETPVRGIFQPFDSAGFHFNKPFLRQEAICSGELLGRPVELLYNKFPFVELHGLLVPEREAERPQLLTPGDHEYVWRLCETLGGRLPGWGVGYNSYGAHASVNHLHFQTFLRQRPLPVERAVWRHHGGARPYPLRAEVYRSAAQAWRHIESLHRADCSYNLLYRPGCVYCLPRRAQGDYPGVPWSSGFAWFEAAGGFVTASREAFEALDEAAISRAMAGLELPADRLQPPSSHSSR